MPPLEHENVRHATLLFRALERRAYVNQGAEEKEEKKMGTEVAGKRMEKLVEQKGVVQPEFSILKGGDINDFERALHSIVEDAPLLLAEMRVKMEAKGFDWVGKPKSAINGLKTVVVVHDHHPQPVDFVVLKENENNNTYLARNPRFMMEGLVLNNERPPRVERKQFDQNLLRNQVWISPAAIAALKDLAQDEAWTVDADWPDGVLWQYLKLTYARLEQQGKIFCGDGCRLFNTGLFDKDYEAIYAYLIPNNKQGKQSWFCAKFARRDDHVMRQNLPHDLERASWFDKFDDLFFDASKEVFPNYEHCMLDNAARLPAELFERLMGKEEYRKVVQFFDKLNSVDDNEAEDVRQIANEYGINVSDEGSPLFRDPKQNLARQFLKGLSGFDNLYADLKRELNNAICVAKKVVSSDYAAAVPTFYPMANSFALMLPLSFNHEGKIDCALVTVRNKSGAYEGKTILSIGMAYSNARILRKPDAHWMTQCIDDNKKSSCN